MPVTQPQSPLWLGYLIPGFSQWRWQQRGRAAVLLGWYLSALGVAVLSWGTVLGSLMLGFAVVVHVFSAFDALEQGAFPGWGRGVAVLSAALGLGLGCYLPGYALASVVAWPALVSHSPPDGFLVNRWAFRRDDAQVGDRVWVGASGTLTPGAAVVLATSGESLERRDHLGRVAGRPPFHAGRESDPAVELALEVPNGHLLVRFESSWPSPSVQRPLLALVPRERVAGRIWSRIQPIYVKRFPARTAAADLGDGSSQS